MPQNSENKKAQTKTLSTTHNGLSIHCFFTDVGKLHKKTERWNNTSIEYTYQFDKAGHLTKVSRNGVATETYAYNQLGQRVEHNRIYSSVSNYPTKELLAYDANGKLVQTGETTFSYNKIGALSQRCDALGTTKFFYGTDTMPDKVTLPSGATIHYEYTQENPLGPSRRFKNNRLTAEYVWENPFQLSGYTDYELQLEYSFTYNNSNMLDKIYVAQLPKKQAVYTSKTDWLENLIAEKRRERLQKLFPTPQTTLKLFCCADQVGTVKIIIDKQQAIKKELIFDSFGVPLYDSLPDLFIPIGFAGGLVDKDTGLVRFGWRDYDPTVGRFTALDPLGDTGGDHDLYDYCVDDPVSMNDPSGLLPPAVVIRAAQAAKHPAAKQLGRYIIDAVKSPQGRFLTVKIGALTLTGTTSIVTAALIDEANRDADGNKTTKAVEAMTKVAPHVLRGVADSAGVGLATMKGLSLITKLSRVESHKSNTPKNAIDEKEKQGIENSIRILKDRK